MHISRIRPPLPPPPHIAQRPGMLHRLPRGWSSDTPLDTVVVPQNAQFDGSVIAHCSRCAGERSTAMPHPSVRHVHAAQGQPQRHRLPQALGGRPRGGRGGYACHESGLSNDRIHIDIEAAVAVGGGLRPPTVWGQGIARPRGHRGRKAPEGALPFRSGPPHPNAPCGVACGGAVNPPPAPPAGATTTSNVPPPSRP